MKLTDAQDHWNALVHEIGHALVAQELGYEAYWQVYPARTQGLRSWEGATALPIGAPTEDRRLIAIAGAISETLIGIIPFSFEPTDLAVVGMLGMYKFSDTDAAYTEGSLTQEEALRCIRLVRELAPRIVELAVANGGQPPKQRLCNGKSAPCANLPQGQ